VLELATRQQGPRDFDEEWQPRAFDPRLDDIVAKATARSPSDRYESAAAMREDLERVRPRGWLRRVFRRR
jgi:hypothetical protein